MKAKELRDKSSSELKGLLEELEKRSFQLKMQHYTGQLEKVSSLKSTRRDIARIKTILGERGAEAR